jgi:hypothetical protein
MTRRKISIRPKASPTFPPVDMPPFEATAVGEGELLWAGATVGTIAGGWVGDGVVVLEVEEEEDLELEEVDLTDDELDTDV